MADKKSVRETVDIVQGAILVLASSMQDLRDKVSALSDGVTVVAEALQHLVDQAHPSGDEVYEELRKQLDERGIDPNPHDGWIYDHAANYEGTYARLSDFARDMVQELNIWQRGLGLE